MIWSSHNNVLPVNRRYIHKLCELNLHWEILDSLLAGIGDRRVADVGAFGRDTWQWQFRSYIDEEERRMHEVLQRLGYTIDDENTLTLVVGRRRPEQVCACVFTTSHF